MEWEEFIDNVLDDLYKVDIRKTGSVVAFAKNQLGQETSRNTEESKFRKSLTAKIDSNLKPSSNALKPQYKYDMLIDLGIAFLGASELFGQRCSSLFIYLSDSKAALKENDVLVSQDLQKKTSFALVKFIEHWKDAHEIIGEKNPYTRYTFLLNIVSYWVALISKNTPLKNPNIIVSLIYLGEWENLLKRDKETFFRQNTGDKALFGSLLYDMQRIKSAKTDYNLYNYRPFLQDCQQYHPEFYAIATRKYAFWAASGGIDKSPKMTAAQTARNVHHEKAREMYEDGWLNKDKFNISQPDKKKDDDPTNKNG